MKKSFWPKIGRIFLPTSAASFIRGRLLALLALGGLLSLIPLALFCAPVPTGKPSTWPGWWFAREAIPPVNPADPAPTWPGSYPLADDYAVANQGQLKNLATAAFQEMQATLPTALWSGPAGQTLSALVQGWNPALGDNFAAINQGQLKNLAKTFYDVLIQAHYTTAYPWPAASSAADNYATANLGQVKNLFSFDLTATDPAHDANQDGIPDWWESYYGITNANAPALRGDGLTNRQAWQQGLNPNDFYNGQTPVLTITGGNNQGDFPNAVLAWPLTVQVSDGHGRVNPNATVGFSINSGGGSLSALNGGRTDAGGLARATLQLPGTVGSTITVTATTSAPSGMAQVTFTATVGDATLAPNAPVNVHCTRQSPTAVLIEWTDDCNNETAFYVERSDDNAVWLQVATLPANSVSYTDAGLPPNEPYSYRVVAHNAAP